jgi:signal transduction histidine kinase
VFDRDRFISYRVMAVRFGLVVSWVALGATALVANADDRLTDTLAVRLAVLGGALLVLSLLPWRRLLLGVAGDVVIVLWCALALVAMLALTESRADEPLVAAFVGVIVFASATLVVPPVLILIGVGTATVYVGAVATTDPALATRDIAIRLGAFAGTTLFALLAAGGVSRELRSASRQLERLDDESRHLEDQQRELDQLYSVSRTIGVGSNLAEVLPELVGRVVTAVSAKLGVVFLYRGEDETLELMSPVWVAGQVVHADGYHLALTDRGMVQRVFTSGEPMIRNDIGTPDPGDTLLTDLETSNVAAVPLRIENRAIGVLMVADKSPGQFTREDIERLTALAGPSALVLNQIARYQEARETGQRMAELAQLKTDFVSVVSHELRTPLTSIIGSLKTLQRPELAPEDSTARDLITTAERQANRLRSLIEDLLVVSRLDNQALPVRPTPTDAIAIANEVVKDVPGAEDLVIVDPVGRVPEMEVDPDHLRRILTNLVENGLKYAPDSPIELTLRSYGTEVWISVIDHGPGIPYELHDHIFQPFTQVDRHETRGAGGTGLGLSIVRGLTEAMGGRVWFEPTVGGGATFTCSLPLASNVRPSAAS